MYDILRNLYTVSMFALIVQFITGLHQPLSVLLGITLLYLAYAEMFQPADIDRLRRMNYISYQRKLDVSIAFIVMTVAFGVQFLANGLNYRGIPLILSLFGALGAIYVVLEPYIFGRHRGRQVFR